MKLKPPSIFRTKDIRLATRARIFYIGLPVFIVVILFTVGTYISSSLSADFAGQLARQYPIEAASNFQNSTGRHFVLMQQISRSTTLSRWLADDDNQANKANAFHKIMSHATFAPDMQLMLTVHGSLQSDNFNAGLSNGPHRYASISPIIGTSWPIVALSSYAAVLGGRYLPIIAIAILLVITAIVVGVIKVRNAARPTLRNLAKSTKEIGKGIKTYDQNKTSEIDDQAKTIPPASISHQLRAPITAILGITEAKLQNTDILPTHMEEDLLKIHGSASLLLNIVNNIESGNVAINCEEYSVINMISDAANLYRAYLNGKNINFNLHVDENLPSKLIGDALHIKQIINNLLSNAFKYTEAGSVELSITCTKDDGFANLMILVTDTGHGMSKEQLENLYENSTHFHESGMRTVTGASLGMPTIYNLVQLMGATIDIDSDAGKGTAIMVKIPQEISDHTILGNEAALRLERLGAFSPDSTKKTSTVPELMPYGSVLIVDDVEANLYVAIGLLSFYDLTIETCNNAQDAIEKIKQGKVYDIIFMDQLMPVISGVEAMRTMRDMGYTHPIIVFTANALMGTAEEFINSGFDGFISKPIDTKQLNNILVKYIKNKQNQLDTAPPKTLTTPAESENIDDYLQSPGLQQTLRLNLARSQQNTYKNICSAIEVNDLSTAHRLANSLKGLAEMIGEYGLMNASENVERLIVKCETPDSNMLTTLENELNQVLNSIETTCAEG